ncbi:MAG TPA: 3-hydroxyacyl-CoA dehydrogenase family protein [Beijerinckiaceae bacterium]|nr:3-hydroxyacyl-CoA dehydrogenase family protein [Beijerinckiaceae bacterium]
MSSKARIALLGAGLMGHGIAQVFAQNGHDVRIYDVDLAARAGVKDRIRANLRILGQDEGCVDRVTPAATIAEAVGAAEFIIEAVVEDLAAKQNLFTEVENHAPADAILASNTSVIPITQIMSGLRDGSRALGTHWWNPPFLVPLVEVIRTADSSDRAVEKTTALLTSVGKQPAEVKKDVPGFVGNRLQHALWREAISLVENGICDAETVDTVVKASFGRRLAVLGPLENADLIGTDLTLAIHRTVLPAIDHTAAALPYLEALVAQGRLGMKSGEGFRTWNPDEQAALRNRVLLHLQRMKDMLDD